MAEKKEPKVFKGRCRVCKGDITENIVRRFNPMSGPMVFGPGSRQQLVNSHEGYYCTKCGISYEFVPGEKTEEGEPH